MNILFINTGPWGTGSFTSIKCLAKELLQLGHQVKIFFPDVNYASIDKSEYYNNPGLYWIWDFPILANSIEIRTFPLMISDPHPRNPNAITFKDLSDEQLMAYEDTLQAELSKLLTSFRPDVVECHHLWYPAWVLSKMGIDYISTAHHSDQLGFCFDARVQKKAIACAQHAKKIIAISKSVKQEVRDLYDVDPNKILVIPNGYDKETFYEKKVNRERILKKHKLSIDKHARIINFAGKLSLTKGIDTLLKANKLLDPALNIQIIVMGCGELSSIIDALDPDSFSLKGMHFIGQQTPQDVADIHNISLLSVMPSRTEGFGIASLEAMACGLPMVVARSGGPEFFSVGRIVNPNSEEELAASIMELLRLPSEEFQQLRREAVESVERFSMKAITQRHLELYEDAFK